MSSREDTPEEPGTSAADSSQAAPAAPQDESREKAACPECRDISTACSSSCRHCFCQLCLWDWSLGEAVCPRCQRPIRHPYPQHVPLYHEVQDRVYDSKRRRRGRSQQRSWSCSGHFGHGRRRRSMRWFHDGRWGFRHGRGSDSPRRRRRRRWWWQKRRAWEDTSEEGRAPRFEWDIPASSRRRRSRRGSRRSWSQQERPWGQHRWSRDRESSHGWDRRQGRSSRREQDTQRGSHDHSERQRRWRSWNDGDRHAPRPQHDVPSERSEAHDWEDSDSSRQWNTRRRGSRGRSHRRGQNSQGMVPHDHPTSQRRRRSWNADDRHTPGPQRDTPSRRSEGLQREDRESFGQQQTTRSRPRGRSHGRGQNSWTDSEGTVPHNHSTRQRQWNADQGRAPRSQRDIPGSSGRSQPRCRSRSRAGHRDT